MSKTVKAIYVASTIESLLNDAYHLPKSAREVYELMDYTPDEIFHIEDEQLQNIASKIYVFRNLVNVKQIKIQFLHGFFRVDILI